MNQGVRDTGGDTIPEDEEVEEQFVCPMCGTMVDASATECSGCGEPFAPIEGLDEGEIPEEPEFVGVADGEIPEEPEFVGEADGEIPEEPEYIEEVFTEESEEIEDLAPEAELDEEIVEEDSVSGCKECGAPLSPGDRSCPECGAEVEIPEAEISGGCPICGKSSYTVEDGDIVSCDECGNVYIRKEFEPPPELKWKWKFWSGLILIIIGDLGIALGSYVHNVMRWSPLGDLYLGYGWLDQMVGIIGIVLFVLGLFLFAWSFKRDREVECPSCKIVIRENLLLPHKEEEEEEEGPEAEAIETALEEIGEEVECPECGQVVSIFNEHCPNCGAFFEVGEEEMLEEEIIEGEVIEEVAVTDEPQELLPASELDEEEMVMESLELLEDETEQKMQEDNGLEALRELESELDLSSNGQITCAKCGAMLSSDHTSCPECGTEISSMEVE